jgi:hypothetical protein
VERCPLAHEPESARGKLSEERFERRNHDLRLVLAVDGVEVRRIVVAEYIVITIP